MTPQKYIAEYPSRERVQDMKWWITEDGGSLPDDFDIDSISWVTPRIGITDFEGSIDSVSEGYLTINVAGELDSPAQVKLAVEPHYGKVLETLDGLANIINEYLYGDDDDTKVVVHCAMGIERSPLTVVWYLHKYMCLTLDEAYALVREARPVAVERRYWIEGYEDTRKER
jgi:hypothetical protein